MKKSSSDKPDSPVRNLFLLAALWLPLGFFLWFKVATVLVYPLARLSELLLKLSMGEQFERIFQNVYLLEIDSLIALDEPVNGQVAYLAWDINPMIYGYGIPLIFGLVMATPLSAWQRLRQLALGYGVMLLVQTWGVFWEVHKDLHYSFSSVAGMAGEASPFSVNLAALCYQLGYLILPAVIPIACWILMNRKFLESIVRWRIRPASGER